MSDTPRKAVVEFELPEEEYEFENAKNVGKFRWVLWDMNEYFLACDKEGHGFKTADEAVDTIRNAFWTFVRNHGVTID